jgi:hypothetical protein
VIWLRPTNVGTERRQTGPAQIGQEHHPLAVAAIGHGPRDHPEQEIGQRLQRPDDAHHQP